MKFYQSLKKKLKNKIPPSKLEKLPQSYQIIGKILLVKLDPRVRKYKKPIGKAIMEVLPYLKTVLWMKGVKGKKRMPDTEVIAGSKNTETLHKEHGCLFLLDPACIMFSKGNKFEKLRLLRKIKKGDVVIDMFAGVGYWSIPIAATKKAAEIYSIDINPPALRYLERNARENNVKLTILRGDCRKYALMLKKRANKIIMGYFGTEPFFRYALQMAKKGGKIYYHDLIAQKDIQGLKKRLRHIAALQKRKIRFISTRKVKSYAPGIIHIVMDVQVSDIP